MDVIIESLETDNSTMCSSSRRGLAWVIALFLAVGTPLVARAECIEIPLPKGARPPNPLEGATLAFSGQVTATGVDEFGVSFQVERVWVGGCITP